MILVADEIFGAVASALEPYRAGSGPITEETVISEDLNLDSAAMMDLMMELEDRFDVTIPLNLMPEIRTVGDFVATIRKLKEGS
jgi:acyl carrier protein